MELDELKVLLHKKLDTAAPGKTDADFRILLSGKKESIVSRIKKGLWFELIACIAFALIFWAIGLIDTYSSLRIYFTIFGFIFFIFIPVFILLLRRTNKLNNNQTQPVKTNLQDLVFLLKEFVKRYFQFTMALIPISLIVALLLGYNDGSLQQDALKERLLPNVNILLSRGIFIAIYLVGLSFGAYYFTKWYLRKMYGKYIEQLEALVKELEK